MQFDTVGSRVVSVVQNASTGGLDLISLAVNTTTRAPSWGFRSLPKQEYEWLYGNVGAVSAFDPLRRVMFVLAGQ